MKLNFLGRNKTTREEMLELFSERKKQSIGTTKFPIVFKKDVPGVTYFLDDCNTSFSESIIQLETGGLGRLYGRADTIEFPFSSPEEYQRITKDFGSTGMQAHGCPCSPYETMGFNMCEHTGVGKKEFCGLDIVMQVSDLSRFRLVGFEIAGELKPLEEQIRIAAEYAVGEKMKCQIPEHYQKIIYQNPSKTLEIEAMENKEGARTIFKQRFLRGERNDFSGIVELANLLSMNPQGLRLIRGAAK